MTQTTAPQTDVPADVRPWPALIAMCIGFFMILVDMTIVTVATPDIMSSLDASENDVLWVTSAYLLAYAAPVLITGRLGDRVGPKWVFLVGMAVFTLASLWCGLSGSIAMLVTARAVQGIGAALITPQTMAVITRIFPSDRRGQAMALWGATAGIATLVGPVLGGALVGIGWEWIFFINVPVGVVAFAANWRLIPTLPTHEHTFDWVGVFLSAVGMFGLVFGLQNGEQRDWDGLAWLLIVGGVAVLAIFVWWEARNTKEPLVPLHIFSDRNFSVANVAITCMGFAAVAIGFPLMLYAQLVRDYSAFRASLLMVPMALVSLTMAPVVGRFTDKVHPRALTALGFALCSIAVFWVSAPVSVGSHWWEFIPPMALLGFGMSMVWAPLAATATRNLPMHLAGAGAGVYNATRLVGSVIGSAGIAVLMDNRLVAHGIPTGGTTSTTGELPAQVMSRFSDAMSQAMWLPALVLAIGFLGCLFFTTPRHLGGR
ncbi:DHA2 family efflux MFS transporter permease subunit [Nocardioides sp. KR10-350]|uniref:DHA2 family efflux MFS transporter permease subunit n=1 Tax=Nocardioides cheoyonin TaxID=3156615 RepID=UPI0032B5E1AC